MSTIKVNKVTPVSGTTLTLSASSETVNTGSFSLKDGNMTVSGSLFQSGSSGTSVQFIDDTFITGSLIVSGSATVTGDLTINGTTTTINSTTLTVDDKNIELASTASPSDTTADGGGITLRGGGGQNYTISWSNSDNRWHYNQGIELDAGDLIVDGGNVGIGTTSPDSVLDVVADISDGGPQLIIDQKVMQSTTGC